MLSGVLPAYLMKSCFPGERHSELRHAGVNSVITAIQAGVPPHAAVLHLLQFDCQWIADCESPATVCHSIREQYVLQMALRRAADVIELLMIILPQHPYRIFYDEHRVIVAHHKPPYIVHLQPRSLRDDPR